MLKPDYTMGGLEVKDNGTANGTVHHRVLRVVLTSRIGDLYTPLSRIVSSAIEKQMSSGVTDHRGWTTLPSWTMAKRIITTANARVYFGAKLMDNTEFHQCVHSFVDDLLFTAEVLRWTPSITHPLVSRLLMRNHRASKKIIEHLTPVVEERLRNARTGLAGSNHPKPVDCVQFFVDANSRKQQWNASRIVQVVLGMWFASVHQPVLTLIYALENLCEHPEYIEPLRHELSTLSSRSHISDDLEAASHASASALENLPLLDAFMKESSRLRPSDAISVRRKVMQPFTFKDGIHIPAGDVLCVPMNAIMRDETIYPDAEMFSAWRFLESTSQSEGGREKPVKISSRFTDSDFHYPLWGLGGHAWYVPTGVDDVSRPRGLSDLGITF
jgi:cytochrome P450